MSISPGATICPVASSTAARPSAAASYPAIRPSTINRLVTRSMF